MKPARLRSIALGLILALAIPLGAQTANEKDLNDIGHRGVGDGMNFYSIEKSIALGKQVAQQIESTARIQKDPEINEYINRLTQNLVRHSDAKVPFTVRVLEDPQVNAMALPGGYFFVNTGLILAADNEAELAGVMSHEIAHVAARHATRRLTKARLINYATLPLIFVGGGIGLAGRSLAEVAMPLSFEKFSRSDEREADYLGVQYMYEAGYDPQAFVQMFEKLLSEEKKQPGTIAKAFDSHPPTPERIKDTEIEIHNILPPRPQYILNTSDFNKIKARLAMLEHIDDTNIKLHGTGRPSLIRPDGSAVPQGRPTLKHRPGGGSGGGGG
ncbi:MAG: M48 family metallopeptidase [Terriglobales bacterium]